MTKVNLAMERAQMTIPRSSTCGKGDFQPQSHRRVKRSSAPHSAKRAADRDRCCVRE
ncbi:hypothetical protein K438DRAFT_1883166 [Mycena galopus ATCC 62051]|nr:hypothetical protein K438DRAFT_1883166 [Mycena galopus ATCC 62051]